MQDCSRFLQIELQLMFDLIIFIDLRSNYTLSLIVNVNYKIDMGSCVANLRYYMKYAC